MFVAPHISSIFISFFFMASLSSLKPINNSTMLSLRVSELILRGTNVMPPLYPSIPTFRHGLQCCGIGEFWFADEYARRLCPIPLFSASVSLHPCFSRCAVGERGQPRPSAEGHSMVRRKGEEKSCLVLSLMSKSMHLSLKRQEREKERRYWDLKDEAKTLT